MGNSNFYNNQQISEYYNTPGNHGNYQYQTLDELINTFMVIYVGESKIIHKADRNDVYFFGRRALQEMNYDVLRSKKTWEFELDSRMYIPLPHDYVGHTHIFFTDDKGIKHPLYPTKDTQNPFRPKPRLDDTEIESQVRTEHTDIGAEVPDHLDDWWETAYQDGITETIQTLVGYEQMEDPTKPGRMIDNTDAPIFTTTTIYNANYTGVAPDNSDDVAGTDFATGNNVDSTGAAVVETTSTTLTNFSGTETYENSDDVDYREGFDNLALGQRYGLDPSRAQSNGSYFFDHANGRLYLSPGLIGSTIVLDYITDGLADGGDALIHKFAEEAFYKTVAYAIVSTGANYSPATIQMLKKERFATTRVAKLRLSNLKSQELTQVMRGKSKWIKH